MGRASKLESELKNQSLNFGNKNAKNMSKVDSHQPPTTFIDFFYGKDDSNFPADASSYYSPPTQEEFALGFFFQHKKDGSTLFTDEYREAWERRARVTYPSLVRDLHFFFLLSEYNSEHGLFESVTYDPQMDVQKGVDAIVETEDKTYYINLYVDTNKSRHFVEQKKSHRHPANNAVELHLTVSRTDSRNKHVGDFWLYSEQHIEDMIDEMDDV